MPRLPTVLSAAAIVALPAAALPSLAGAAPPGSPSGARAAQSRSQRPDGKPIRNGRVGVDTISDRPDTNPGDGVCRDRKGRCSLRAAIDEANARDGGLRISLQRGRKNTLRQGALRIDRNVTIVGRNAIVNANRNDRAFVVASGVRLTIGKTRISNGVAPAGENGGAILNSGRLVLKGGKTVKSSVSGPSAAGGAIFNAGGTVILKDTAINRNSASHAGGAVAATGGSTLLRRTKLLVNTANFGGGLFLFDAARSNIRNSTIDRNVANVLGGGLWLSRRGNVGVADTAVTRNTAKGGEPGQGGGGLYTEGGDVRVDRGSFGGNAADGAAGDGGAILSQGGRLLLFGVEIRMNRARRVGGGVAAVGGRTSFGRANLNGNTAIDGGAVHAAGDGVVDVAGTTVAGNSAAGSGGGLWSAAQNDLIVRDSTLVGNTAAGADAAQGGGGIYAAGSVDVARGVVADNRATGANGSGGGILNARGALQITGAEVRGNTANRAGGGVEAIAGTTRLVSVRLISNTTGSAPGDGGGLHVTGAGSVDVRDSDVSRNSAANAGGGVANSAEGTVAIARTTLLGNVANGQGGGALHNAGGRLSVDGGQLADNAAPGAAGTGGGVLNAGRGVVSIANAALQANRAAVAGGGVWAGAQATTTVAATTIAGNVAPRGTDLFNQPPGGRFTVDGRAVDPTP